MSNSQLTATTLEFESGGTPQVVLTSSSDELTLSGDSSDVDLLGVKNLEASEIATCGNVYSLGLSVRVTTEDTINSAAGTTWTATQMVNGVIVRDNQNFGQTDTTATATNIIGAITNAVDDMTFYLIINNIDGSTISVTGGTGVTIEPSDPLSITGNSVKILYIRITSVGSNTVTIYDN